MSFRKKQMSIINNLTSGVIIITLGIIITISSNNMYTNVIRLLVYVFLIYGISKLINFLLNKKIVRNNQVLFGIFINIFLGIIMLIFPNIPVFILPFIFSLYLLFNSLVQFINYFTLKELKLKIRFKNLFFSLFFLSFSLIFLCYPIKKLSLFFTIIGMYCTLLGINRIYEFLIDLLTDKYKLKIKRKLKLTLPVFFEAFIPKRGLKLINKYIDYLISEEKEYVEDTNLKIFIHLSKYGFNQLGHVDIMFEDKIYSYGNYDKSSEKFFTCIGDGVLFSVNDKNKYIKFCIENSRKTIVEYGIKLNEKEKEKIKNELNNIMSDCIEWKPPIIIDKNKKHIDYASKLYISTKANFYKFKTSKYRTYFVLGINCTYFADELLKNSIFEVLKLVGILSPGTYFEYLEENYKKKNSNIVSKRIYNKESIGDSNDKNKK